MSHPAQDIRADDPGLRTDYDGTTHGFCADGHPVNSFGRCAPLNAAARVIQSPKPVTPRKDTP